MKVLVVFLTLFLSSCSMYNECAERGAKWGAVYGLLTGDHSVPRVYAYSVAGRYIGSNYCNKN